MSAHLALLTRERIRNVSAAIVAVNAVLYSFVIATGTPPFDGQGTIVLPDFMAHLSGGALVSSGRASLLYDVEAQHAFEVAITHDAPHLDLFLSPPLSAWLYAPFASLPYAVAAAAWTAISFALLAVSAWMLGRLVPSLATADRRLLVLAFFASQPVIQILGSGQDTAISLLIWVSGVHLALARRDAASGLVFSLGLFKPQLFLFPPILFVLLRRRASVASWMAGALGQIGLTLTLFGVEGLRGWWRILRSPQYLLALRVGRGLRMGSAYPFVQSIAPDSWRSAAAVLGAIVCVGVTMATLVRCAPGRAGGPGSERALWALVCVATLLVTPHLFYYDLALLILPVALLCELGPLSPTVRNALLAFSVLTWTAAARAPLESAAWPVRALAASWTPIPMLFLWRELWMRFSPRASALNA